MKTMKEKTWKSKIKLEKIYRNTLKKLKTFYLLSDYILMKFQFKKIYNNICENFK